MNEEKEGQDRTLKDDIEDKTKKQAEKGFKMVLKAIISTVVMPLIPYLIVILIITGFLIGLFDILASAADNKIADVASKAVIEEQVEIEKNLDGEYYFKINNKIIDEYLKELNRAYDDGYYHGREESKTEEDENGEGEKESENEKEEYKYDEETAEITRSDLENIFGTENFEAYLVKMIRAEIASSYPKLSDYAGDDIDGISVTDQRHKKLKNKVDSKGNFVGQGIVKIKRTPISEDGTVGAEKELKYIPYESEKEGEQTFKGMIQAQNIDVLDYYSFDQEKGVVYYATYGTSGEGTTLTEGQVQYKSVASMCSMPFNFLFSLLQTSKNPEWIMAVCDLVLEQQKDREVVIMIQDQLTKTVTTETWYSVIMTEKQGYIVDEFGRVLADGQTSYNTEIGSPEVRQTVTIQNTANVYIQKANTWCLDFEQTAKITKKESHTENEYNISTGDATFGDPTYDSGGMNTDVAGKYETTRTSVSNEKYLGKTTTDTTTYTAEVEGGEKKINHDRFLGLWKNEKGEIYEDYKFERDGKLVGYTMEKGGKRYPPKDISERNEQRIDILLDLLSKHEDTQTQEQLMMHFWNVYMGEDIYDINVDSILDLFNTKIMKTVSGVSGISLLRKYIHSWERSTPISADGTMYQIVTDPVAGTRAVGHGIDLDAGGYWAVLEAAGYPTTVGAWVPVEFIDSLSDNTINEHLERVKATTSGLNLKEYQLHALTSFSYNLGNINGFVEAYKNYWREGDDLFDGVNTNANLSHGLYTNYFSQYVHSGGGVVAGLVRRRKSEWILFQTGYYDQLGVWYREGAEEVVEIALSYVGSGYQTFGLADNWCAQFVSFCFDKAGLIPDVLPEKYTGCTSVIRNVLRPQGKFVYANSGYIPKAGDIFFIVDDDPNYESSHTGIVTDCDGTTVYTVEGNSGTYDWSTSTVGTFQYSINSPSIYGYMPS